MPVALRVRAWIEISRSRYAETPDAVALRVRAWIEIIKYSVSFCDRDVALRVRAWIEILPLFFHSASFASPSV